MSLTIGGEYNEGIVSYIFHHNLHALDWDDPRVDKDGLHPRVYIDAGGHRSMYGPGMDINLAWGIAQRPEGEKIRTVGGFDVIKRSGEYNLSDLLEDTDMHDYWLDYITPYAFYGVAEGAGDSTEDPTIGIMVKKFWNDGTLPSWRGESYTDYSISLFPLDSMNAGWDEGETLKVEDFENRVWVLPPAVYWAVSCRADHTRSTPS